MDRPADFFSFSVPSDNEGHYTFVFSPDVDLFAEKLNAICFGAFEGPMAPEAIVILGPDSDAKQTLKNLRDTNSGSEAESVRERLGGRTPLVYLSLNTSRLGSDEASSVFPGTAIPVHLETCITERSWLTHGLTYVFQPDLVIHHAPPGYAFLKPSGESSSTFLKPEFALSSSPRVFFVAFALLKRVFEVKENYANSLQVIYVDTMAISPVAFALRELLQTGGSLQPIRISSFHSYHGMEPIPGPLPERSLCVISASSSMALQEKWVSSKNVAPSEVITLLTKRSAPKSERALFCLETELEEDSEGPPELCIKIYGESFVPALEVPKKVLLRYEAHRIDVDAIHKLRDLQIFDVHTPDRASSGNPRTIHVNGSNLVAADDFTKWIDKNLPQLLRANCRHIIHQNDAASEQLAKNIATKCKTISGLLPNCLSASEVSKSTIDKSAALITCAAVAGKGSELLQISRSLRDLHEGPRLYLIGLQVTDTKEEILTLKNNLKFREPHHYDYAIYGSIATGSQLGLSFRKEEDLYKSRALKPSPALKSLSARIDTLGTTSYTGDCTLLPFGGSADVQMNLRSGFAFWHPRKYSPKPYHAEVIATIAGILQRAREDKKIPAEHRLSSPTFRHILLDPENFSRYNDGVIQAAILRCAYPSELDYRSDYYSSDFITQLIIRLVVRMNTDQGEAALEFLLALATGNLKIHKSHLEAIKDSIHMAPVDPELQEFMHTLLSPSSRSQDSADMEF